MSFSHTKWCCRDTCPPRPVWGSGFLGTKLTELCYSPSVRLCCLLRCRCFCNLAPLGLPLLHTCFGLQSLMITVAMHDCLFTCTVFAAFFHHISSDFLQAFFKFFFFSKIKVKWASVLCTCGWRNDLMWQEPPTCLIMTIHKDHLLYFHTGKLKKHLEWERDLSCLLLMQVLPHP